MRFLDILSANGGVDEIILKCIKSKALFLLFRASSEDVSGGPEGVPAGPYCFFLQHER